MKPSQPKVKRPVVKAKPSAAVSSKKVVVKAKPSAAVSSKKVGEPDLSKNPYLQIEDPYKDAKAKETEAQSLAVEFQRLCYSVFHEYADGVRLWDKFKDMYLLQSQVNPAAGNASEMAIWWDGFKACMVGMHKHGLEHIKRINGAK